MPFITEEIYLNLYDIDESIMISNYSDYQEGFIFEEEENEIELLKKIITEIRNVRTTMNVHPSKKSELIFVTTKYKDLIESSENFLLKLGFGEKIVIEDTKKNISDDAISILNTDIDLYIPFEDLVNIEEEIERLENEKAKYMSEVKRSEGILSNENFLAKAPKEKVELEKEKLQDYKDKLDSVNNRLETLKK
jgi:valyl-tRNA synthetase